MTESGPHGLTIAPLRRRVAAGLIDLVVLGLPFLIASGGATAVYLWYERRHGRDIEPPLPFTTSPRWNPVLRAATAGVGVQTRNWRSPGYRALGLRRADARSGGPLSVRHVLVRDLVLAASSQLRKPLTNPWLAGYQARVEVMRSEMEDVRRAHPDDRVARQQAMQAVYERHHVSPIRSCAPALVVAVLIQAPALWSPLNQTVAERIAGIVVVQD
jgi:hypothetical protein